MKTMHHALTLTGSNPIARIADAIKSNLGLFGKQTFVDLWNELYGSASKEQMVEALEMLQDTKQVEMINGKDELGEPLAYYQIRK